MMRVISRDDIVAALDDARAIELIEAGFVALSAGKVTMPPVGHLDIQDPPGECHIKYGHIHGDDFFAIKLATGFYENAAQGLPSGSGMTIVFSAKTGFPEVLLDDAGYLTDVRTARRPKRKPCCFDNAVVAVPIAVIRWVQVCLCKILIGSR